jgi:hypothetical protein
MKSQNVPLVQSKDHKNRSTGKLASVRQHILHTSILHSSFLFALQKIFSMLVTAKTISKYQSKTCHKLICASQERMDKGSKESDLQTPIGEVLVFIYCAKLPINA